MGYDLMGGKGREFRCHCDCWAPLLLLAVTYGWEHEYPLGEYLGNDWQSVSDADAITLGAAIERASIVADDEEFEEFITTDTKQFREYLLKFAEFCRAGGFRIG